MSDTKAKLETKAKKLIKNEYVIWLTTIDSERTPQPRPVWFISEKDSVLIFSQAKAHKVKHILNNPNVSLHFNSKDAKGEEHLIILNGIAKIDRITPPANKLRAYMRKYKTGIIGLNATPEAFSAEYSVPIRITPTKLRGWE